MDGVEGFPREAEEEEEEPIWPPRPAGVAADEAGPRVEPEPEPRGGRGRSCASDMVCVCV